MSPQLRKALGHAVTLLDWSLIQRTVEDVVAPVHGLSAKFAVHFLRSTFGIDEHYATDCITDGANDRGIDAILFRYEECEIHFFQFKYCEKFENAGRNVGGRVVDNFISFFSELLQQSPELIPSCNKLLQEKILEVWELLKADASFELHIHVATNGLGLEASHRERLGAALGRSKIRIHEYDGARISEGLSRRSYSKEKKTLQFLPNARVQYCSSDRRGLMGIVGIAEIAKFVSSPEDSGKIDQTLFHANVRHSLGTQNSINLEIAATLSAPESNDFVFLNNGITIVCDQLLYQVGGDFPVELINPQIVNGGQTAFVIHETTSLLTTAQQSSSESPSVRVVIVESGDEGFRERIAVTTNAQNRTYGRDLRANDQTQLKLAAGLRRAGYHYVRKRGEASPVCAAQTIDMLRAGQVILAYFRRQPEKAKTASNEIFGDLYDDVFDPNFVTPERMIAAHQVFRNIENRKEIVRQNLRSRTTETYTEEWLMEGSFHALFVTALICERDGVDCSDGEAALSRIDESVEIISGFWKEQQGAAAYRVFRSVATSEKLRCVIEKTQQQARKASPQQLSLL